MTPTEVITEVRRLVQDQSSPYRYSDAVLLGYVNQTIKRMAILRPDLFTTVGSIPTVADTVIQNLPTGAVRLMDIFSIDGGNAVSEVSREDMNRSYPGWLQEAAGQPVNYMRHTKNPAQFFLYPRPTAGVVLFGEYAYAPPNYAASDTIEPLIDVYFPALVDGTVFLAESIDDEHVQSGRAKLFYDSFVQQLGASLKARTVTDTKDAGMAKGEVI